METKKRILILGINCFPELTGIGKYSGEMISWLAENEYHSTMVTAPPYYPDWKVQKPYSSYMYRKEHFYGNNLNIYRCPLYVPTKPSGIKRLIHEATFFISAFFVVFMLLFQKKHEILFAIAPPFHLGFLALFYRLFKGGKIVYHIQDLQIEAAKELEMLPRGLFNILFGLEHFILRQVDHVSTISDGMLAKIKLKIDRKLILFPNWVDTKGFHPLPNRKLLKVKWGYELEDQVVLYSGSIGEKQGLDSLIRIASLVKDHQTIKFLICGTGPFKNELVKMTLEMKLLNVRFLPFQDYLIFNEFLNMADLHLVLQKADASDLVMPSKLTTILSVGGLSLVTASSDTTLHNLLSKNNMGVLVPPGDEQLLASEILKISTDNFDLQRHNAREYAAKFLDKESILPKMIYDIS